MLPLAAALVAVAVAAEEPPRPGDAPGWTVREEIVALVRGPGAAQPRVLTLTRLEDEARVALVSRGGTDAAAAPLDAAALRAALDWLVDQTLLADEATRLEVLDVDPADVDAELRRFRERFGGETAYRAFLDRLELAEEELAGMLRRALRVARYVESRTAASDPEGAARRVRALVADLRARSDVRIVGALEGAGR
jgi:hypothetical protein